MTRGASLLPGRRPKGRMSRYVMSRYINVPRAVGGGYPGEGRVRVADDASTGGRRPGTTFLSRRRARREQLARLQDNESTLQDRLYGTEFEGYVFPEPHDVDEPTAVACMRFALRHGRELFLAGAETRAIESATVAVTARWGMDHMTVDVISRTIQAQYAPPGARPSPSSADDAAGRRAGADRG
ncbi:hypothetical protein LUR56_18255 [Streptomyces sp. MT29]|nr:hypothetical protein [Streptomyces sp. MT29]